MEFKLVLTANRPTAGELVLEPEVPLSGVRFIEEVGKALRKSIDHIGRHRHTTLGALATYEITVPQQMALESGLFTDTDTVTAVVENNLLSYFVFYAASVSSGAAGRPCYPYMQNEASLISMIDELTFLEAWAATGYSLQLMMNGNQMVGCNYIPPASGSGSNTGSNGGCGCDGCTCGKDETPRPPHHHHPGHCPPPPPKPPLIGNPSGGCGNWDQGAARPGQIRLEPIETTKSNTARAY